MVKDPPAVGETWARSLGWADPLEKGTATHSSVLAWRIPWTAQSTGSQSQTRLSDFHFHFLVTAEALADPPGGSGAGTGLQFPALCQEELALPPSAAAATGQGTLGRGPFLERDSTKSCQQAEPIVPRTGEPSASSWECLWAAHLSILCTWWAGWAALFPYIPLHTSLTQMVQMWPQNFCRYCTPDKCYQPIGIGLWEGSRGSFWPLHL